MNVTLNPGVESRIQQKLESGEFERGKTRTAIEEALGQAERGEGIALEDFDRQMRAKYDLAR
jgi:hypothetical protein